MCLPADASTRFKSLCTAALIRAGVNHSDDHSRRSDASLCMFLHRAGAALSGYLVPGCGRASSPGMAIYGGLGQTAAGRPTTSFRVAKRAAISCRYRTVVSRWRRGRKCGDIPLNAGRNRCALPGEVKRFLARSAASWAGGSSRPRLFRYSDRQYCALGESAGCSTFIGCSATSESMVFSP
jgi:hypothetical protein